MSLTKREKLIVNMVATGICSQMEIDDPEMAEKAFDRIIKDLRLARSHGITAKQAKELDSDVREELLLANSYLETKRRMHSFKKNMKLEDLK
tara:strand:- start:983 stop:1258 length:276 start_codon:yes stop_codon:yes gene_type:complete